MYGGSEAEIAAFGGILIGLGADDTNQRMLNT